MALTADVVIIGGGATGTSTAFHLAKRGVRNVVLLEKQLLASGPTGRSSACVRQHYSTPETCRLVLKALRFFERFEEHTKGRTAGFTRTGYLLGVDDRLRKQMEASVKLQQSQGIDSRLIAPIEAREIEPRLAIDDLTAACYEPAAGYADPAQTTQGLAAAAREMGVRIMEETAVTGIRTASGRVTAVETSRGTIETPTVVNAAGTWSHHVARMVGVDLPITVCRHKIALVGWPREARGPHPMVYDFVTNIYTRPETGDMILVGPLDSEELDDRADPDAYREGLNFDEKTDLLARAATRFPVLEQGAVEKAYAGCFDVTPDWHPVIDETGPQGFYISAGFSGHGFKLSPAIGDMTAALVADGKKPGDDVHAFRFSRFAEGKPIRGTYGDWLMC
ncbi:MAG: FAD-binding oxidoreductase [Candidatus Rokubacteria bacterium]|nr:FAD-binding oxidoreductase [Candidatus Rokubacteria bacterium]